MIIYVGELHTRKFVDFSTNRNEALKIAGDKTEYILSLNGDDFLLKGDNMRKFLHSHRGLTAENEAMYLVSIDYGHKSIGYSERIFRTANHAEEDWPNDNWNHWRYEGVTHEVYISNKVSCI